MIANCHTPAVFTVVIARRNLQQRPGQQFRLSLPFLQASLYPASSTLHWSLAFPAPVVRSYRIATAQAVLNTVNFQPLYFRQGRCFGFKELLKALDVGISDISVIANLSELTHFHPMMAAYRLRTAHNSSLASLVPEITDPAQNGTYSSGN